MNDFFQLLWSNKKWVIYFPLLAGLLVFLFVRNIPNTYTCNMVIYTGIASGFNPENDFEGKVDFHAINSKFDNIINIIQSGQTRKDISIRLLAYMLHHPSELKNLLVNAKSEYLTQNLTLDFVNKYKQDNEQLTAEFIDVQLAKGQGSAIYDLIYGKAENPFQVKTLKEIKADRVDFSDMLKIEYTCEDPLTCKKTLDFAKEVFLEKYRSMRIGEANQAVKYFRTQTAISKEKLQEAENILRNFRAANGVINYYEQTKYIADQKEDIDQEKSALEMEISGYRSALQKVQSKIDSRYLLQLESEKMVLVKNTLSSELNTKGIEAIKGGSSSSGIQSNGGLKVSLKESVDRLYALNNTTEGVPGKSLLEEWLRLSISQEQATSKLKVLVGNKADFEKVYDRYAPMGSDLNKLEREVETSEKEYLNLLHNLNQAILRENNLKVSENLSIMDEATIPFVPNPSKRLMLVLATIFSCLVLVVIVLVVQLYLDNSLYSPLQLEIQTGLKAATAFLDKKTYPELTKISDERSYKQLNIFLQKQNEGTANAKTVLAIPFNVLEEEMSTYINGMKVWMEDTVGAAQSVEGSGSKNTVCVAVSNMLNVEEYNAKALQESKMVLLFFDAKKSVNEYQMAYIEGWKKSGLEVKGVLLNMCEEHFSKYLGVVLHKHNKFQSIIKKTHTRYAK